MILQFGQFLDHDISNTNIIPGRVSSMILQFGQFLDHDISNTNIIPGRVSSMIMQFGQFLDHDISNTNFPEKRCCIHTDRPECFNILVPSSDLTYNQVFLF